MTGSGQEVFSCVAENKKGFAHSTWKGVRWTRPLKVK